MKTLTAANSVFALTIPGLYPVAQPLVGYSTDDAFTADDISPSEVQMGVDGKLSGGYTPQPVVMTIMLQADSPSCALFDDWYGAQQTANELYLAGGVAVLTATGDKYDLTKGFLTSYSVMPGVKKQLQPRKFVVTWEKSTKASF